MQIYTDRRGGIRKAMKRIAGNIGALMLPDGKYAFGLIFKQSYVGWYKYHGENEKDLPVDDDYAFIISVHKEVISTMKLVGKKPIADEKEIEPPPQRIVDPFTGKCEIYINGEIKPSTYEECKDLENCACWELRHVTDRLMGNNKWQNYFRKPKPE